MASDYPSSNPFRRKAPASIAASAPAEDLSIVNHIAYQQTNTQPPSESTNPSSIEAPKKATKKVRVQSPPPSSPSIPDSSTIGEDAYSISAKPPTPIPRDENDPFDSTADDTSEDEGVITSAQAQAPANPFQKTLETMEHPERGGPVVPPANVAGSVKASLDVDAFKRLLMTGNAGLGISTPPTASQAPAHHGLGDGGSSTDTSSISRQSIFEPIQEAHSESPRTSHEISEPEDDSRGLTAEISTAGRKKPPPPSSRHGKLIKVELREDPSSIPLASPQTPSSSSSNQFFNSSPAQRSQTDLNKPLPPAPARGSHDSEDRESIFDKESAGKTPEPPSPSASLRRKTPPAPPLTRRHSQMVTGSKLTIRGDTGRISPKTEEDSLRINYAMDIGRPRSDSTRAPPPPPTRRPANVRGLSHQVPLMSPSLPPIPPVRGSSRSISGRPPSIASMDISPSPISASNAASKRASMLPPPPPPPRHGRTSLEEGSRRTSSDHSRRSIDSARRGSETSSITRMARVESPEPVGGNNDGHFILAEMTRLQKEIDDMRAKSERVT